MKRHRIFSMLMVTIKLRFNYLLMIFNHFFRLFYILLKTLDVHVNHLHPNSIHFSMVVTRYSCPIIRNLLIFFSVWIFGLLLVFIIKLIHFVIFLLGGDHCLSFNSNESSNENSTVHIHSPSIKYRLWLGLGLNAFTCGLMLGTIIYHLIPHVSKR
jgi:hypothetical protein